MSAKVVQHRTEWWTGERIKKLRKRLRMTQVDFAAKLGVSFASVNRWENDQHKPSQLAAMRMGELSK